MTVPATNNTTSNDTLITSNQTSSIGQSELDFYNLLTTQLTNQNPLEPVSETDFLGQMAQFSTVEQLENFTKNFSAASSEQQWLEAQSFLGRDVKWTSSETNSDGEAIEYSGSVDRIMRDAEGEIWLEVGDEQVALEKVTVVAPGQ
jgi:flagellar basal-body rod modification protein FlgD